MFQHGSTTGCVKTPDLRVKQRNIWESRGNELGRTRSKLGKLKSCSFGINYGIRDINELLVVQLDQET